MPRPFPLILTLFLAIAGASLRAESPLQHLVFLPDVSHGTIGEVYMETTVVISNPGPAQADVEIGYSLGPGPATDSLPGQLSLKPGQTARVKVSGEPYESGPIRLLSDNPFAATAHIQTRTAEGSHVLLGEMAVLGQELVSKCTIPVFVNHVIAENTGIVLRPYHGAYLLLKLYDADGELVGSKRLEATPYEPPPPVRQFITEMFPELTGRFQSGCLVIEDTVPTALSFVAMAVYTRGYSMRAGAVSAEDIPVDLIVQLTTPGNVPEQANELAERYHFSLREAPGQAPNLNIFLGFMPLYKARVVAQDERVSGIYPNQFGYLSGAKSPKYLKGK